MSVRAKNITLLSKALLPLPEKFHGLQDRELRYRQRYVDLIVNPEVKRNFVIRSKFIKHVRDFLDGRGYMEVETPVPVSYTHLVQINISNPSCIFLFIFQAVYDKINKILLTKVAAPWKSSVWTS